MVFFPLSLACLVLFHHLLSNPQGKVVRKTHLFLFTGVERRNIYRTGRFQMH